MTDEEIKELRDMAEAGFRHTFEPEPFIRLLDRLKSSEDALRPVNEKGFCDLNELEAARAHFEKYKTPDSPPSTPVV